MNYTEKAFSLKDGRTCVVRRPEERDAQDILDYQKVTSGETPYLAVGQEDISWSVEEQAQRIRRWNDSPRQLRLMAQVEGRLAGVAIVYGSGSQQRLSHRCSVDITIYKRFWGLGIGTVLLGELLGAASAAGYEQAELEVVSANTSAIGLYKKLGFRRVGTIPRALRYSDGSYASFDIMVKPLDDGSGA